MMNILCIIVIIIIIIIRHTLLIESIESIELTVFDDVIATGLLTFWAFLWIAHTITVIMTGTLATRRL